MLQIKLLYLNVIATVAYKMRNIVLLNLCIKLLHFFKNISLESLRQNCQAFLLTFNFSLGQKPCFRTFKTHCL